MSDNYLWDRSGPPDPEVARLEELLAPFAAQHSTWGPALAGPLDGPPKGGPYASALPATSSGRWIGLALLAASVAILIGGVTLAHWFKPAASFEVTRVAGTPTIGSKPVADQAPLLVGGWLETNDGAKARVKVADIGEVNLDPRSRLRLVATRAGDHRLELARGTLHATIWAPPGQFFVATPSSTAIDLGCAYTLTIDDEGAGLVTVTLGWVGFEWRGREAFIPAGFKGATRPAIGPGTPYHKDTSRAVQAALDTIDFRSGAPDTTAALDLVLGVAQERDEVTLWHLLSRVEPAERDRVFDALARFVAPPAGVTREGIREGRRDMLDQWWDALGLGTVSWWRTWKQQWPNGR